MRLQVPSFRNPFTDPARGRAILWRAAAGLVVIVTVAVYFQLDGRRKAAEASLKSRQADIAAAKAGGLESFTPQELAGLQKAASDFKGGFTSLAEVPTLLDSLSDEANRNDVIVLSIRSEAPETVETEAAEGQTAGEKLKRLPIAMSLRGNTRSIGGFLRSLSQSSKRIFAVERYVIKRSAPPALSVECDLTLSFFSNEAA